MTKARITRAVAVVAAEPQRAAVVVAEQQKGVVVAAEQQRGVVAAAEQLMVAIRDAAVDAVKE